MGENTKKNKTAIEAFIEGARNGYHTSMNFMTPNVVFAFVLIQVLKLTGLLDIIGKIFSPVMGIFGLPGVAATVLISAWLSTGGGIGAAASLYAAGSLTGPHISILLPAIILMGSQIQYMGRLLGVAEVKTKYYPHLFGICILNALIAMLVMNAVVRSGVFSIVIF